MLALLIHLLGVMRPSESRLCQSPPPGINKMRRGVDVTTLDLLPHDLTTTSQDGFRKPVIDFTCDLNHTWTDRRKNTYDLPDQIWDILNVGGGWSNANVKIFKDYKEVKKSMAISVGLGLKFRFGMFSGSGSYKKMQHSISQSSRYIEEVSAYDAALKVDLRPALVMAGNRYFKLILNRLPEQFTSNPSQYFSFIRYFGTHFFTSANFGGNIRLTLETKSSYFRSKSDSEVEAQAKAFFFSIVKLSESGSKYNYQVDQNFKSSSSESLRYFGGDFNPANDIGTWQPTVITNPWMFSGDLVPISEFISDERRKASMNRAVTAYLNKAYLREMERILLASVSLTWAESQIKSLLTKVRAELRQVEPNQSVVDLLGKEIKQDFTVPPWFMDDLQLCYKWYADGDRGECGGGAAPLLCASPGKMTSVYRDDTDSRAGGCRMSWGLIPKKKTQPFWFQKVQICFRWYADGDAGQCQSGRGSVCAKLGSYTRLYRDDTDNRSGGCRLSWKMSVPSTAPKWLLNTELCYKWYADEDGGQCGGGVPQNLCAPANTWTTYYRDDTDWRSGGCRMSWGIKMG